MPKLFDLLSERTDKDALKKLQKSASKKTDKIKPGKKSTRKFPLKKTANKKILIYTPDFIAIDLETTGLDHKTDRVIEIGAVRFIKGEPAEEFVSFVNPKRPVPALISDLTGITDEDVAEAPVFSEIVDNLLEFISYLYLCGHQVEFDYNFLNTELKRAGKENLKNLLLDTAVLTRLLLFNLPGYSLANICRHLAITQEKEHRALDDARACGKIAGHLIPKLNDISVSTRMIMGKFAPPSMLKTLFIKSAGKIKEIPALEPDIKLSRRYKRLSLPEEPDSIEKDFIEQCFSETGKLSQLMDGYAHRPSQLQMSLDITKALNDESFLVAEAGTGTGKSMAYLIPAAQWAFDNDTRVLVSTHTKNLQDQLVSKDLPVVGKIMGKGFRYTALKGRSNYLCLYRWNRFLSGDLGNISKRERMGILPLIRWAEETKSGDIEGQNQFNRRWYARIWSFVSADMHGCLGRRCPLFNSCFLQQARQKALSSHIVVINHALFFSDICAESSFLGKTGTIIFDEAHHLESCGHRYLRVEIDTNRVNRYIDSVNNLVKVLESDKKINEGVVRNYKNVLRRLRKNAAQFLSDTTEWAVGEPAEKERNGSTDIYVFAYRDNPFSGLSSLAGFKLVIKEMQDVLFSIQEFDFERKAENPRLHSDVSACMEKTSQLKADLSYLSDAVTDDHVFWVEGDRKKRWVKLCGVPLDIGELLSTIWKGNNYTIIFTSATMTVSGSIDYFKRKVGLEGELEDRTSFKVFSSPFSKEQMLRCAVQSSLLPDASGYNEYIADVIIRLLNAFNRNILVLFTANSMLYGVHKVIKNSTEFPEDGAFFVQGISGTRATLLDKFKESKKGVLLGTTSFWEGIDAPGDACEIVIIPRLPFPVPTHPLTQALAARVEEKYGDSFFGYSVPEAVIRFRQGAGRLIRTGKDRGVFIVLDGRVISKAYGKVFVDSLEGEFIKSANVDEMMGKIETFFNNN